MPVIFSPITPVYEILSGPETTLLTCFYVWRLSPQLEIKFHEDREFTYFTTISLENKIMVDLVVELNNYLLKERTECIYYFNGIWCCPSLNSPSLCLYFLYKSINILPCDKKDDVLLIFYFSYNPYHISAQYIHLSNFTWLIISNNFFFISMYK